MRTTIAGAVAALLVCGSVLAAPSERSGTPVKEAGQEASKVVRFNFQLPAGLDDDGTASKFRGPVEVFPPTGAMLGHATRPIESGQGDVLPAEDIGQGQSTIVRRARTSECEFDFSVGTSAPPLMLDDCLMYGLPVDERPLGELVSSVELPYDVGTLQFPAERPLMHLRIGQGWDNWSHGYVGDLYWTYYATRTTLTFPDGNRGKFHGYLCPNSTYPRKFRLVVNGVFDSGEFYVDGATYFGIVAEPQINTIEIICTSGDSFAIGEMGMCCFGPDEVSGACCDPATGTCADGVDAYACLPPSVFTPNVLCADLDTPCGNPGACCDEVAGTCAESVLEADCSGPGQRFLPGGTCGDFDPACGAMELTINTQLESPAPPARLCSAPMVPFASNPYDWADEWGGDHMLINRVPAACPELGDIAFSEFVYPLELGVNWAGTWGHGYNGYVYMPSTAYHELTLTFPPGNDGEFYGYVAPNDGTNSHDYKIFVNGVESETFIANTRHNPTYFGVCVEPELETIRIVCTSHRNFAIGDLGMSCVGPGEVIGACCDPYTGACVDDVDTYDCEPPLVLTADTSCADLEPDCGNPGACCDEIAGVCTEGVFELNCQEIGQRFIAGGTCADFDPPCGAMGLVLDIETGTGAPPAELCGCAMTPLAADDRQHYEFVTTIPLPCGIEDAIESDTDLFLLSVGDGWQFFGHDYAGDVYFAWGAEEITLTFPSGLTKKFHGYVMPNNMAEHDFELIINGVRFDEFTVDGATASQYIGVCTDTVIDSITIRCTTGSDFAIGDLGVCCFGPGEAVGACCDPLTGVCQDNTDAVDCALPLEFTRNAVCADLEPLCGNPGACCDSVTGICTEDVVEADCTGPEFRFLPGGTCADFDPPCDTGVSFGLDVGTDAPPAVVCDRTMVPFAADTRPMWDAVTTIPLPCATGGEIELSEAMWHATVIEEGGELGGWTHGYTGDTYIGDTPSVTLSFPPGYQVFYGYIRLDLCRPSTQEIQLIVNGEYVSPEFTPACYTATYFSVCVPDLRTLEIVNLRSRPFTLGEFGVACTAPGEVTGACCDFDAGICTDNVDVFDCVPPLIFTRDALCGDLDPPCGNPGACCDELAGTCAAPVLEVDCCDIGQRFIPGGECSDFDPPCGEMNVTFDFSPGTGAPPMVQCDCLMEGIVETRPVFSAVDDILIPCSDDVLALSYPLSPIDYGFASWGGIHYGEEVYMFGDNAPDKTSITLTFPPGYNNFQGYLSPGTDGVHGFKLIVHGGNGTLESDEFTADGTPYGGYREPVYFGACSDDMEALTIVSTTGAPIIIGHLGICCDPGVAGACCDPYTGVCEDNVMPANCLEPLVFTEGALCSELDPPCYNPGACCDDETGVCEDGVQPIDCAGRFEPGVSCGDLVPPCGSWSPFLQAPGWSSDYCIVSDLDCEYWDPRIHIVADSFELNDGAFVTHVTVWGGYYPDNSALDGSFTLKLREDNTGVPGRVLSEIGPVTPTYQVRTGVLLPENIEQWKYIFALADGGVNLPPGAYWLELYNDTAGSTDTWRWHEGSGADGGQSVSGYAWTVTLPEEPWVFGAGLTMSLQLWGDEYVAPACDLDGDYSVDMDDYFIFRDAFGTTDPVADLDGNGVVDFDDFRIFWNCYQEHGLF